MIVDENIAELICALEYKIGNQTYNPNSYNGWTGEEGCRFKYPVSYCKNKIDLEEHKITMTVLFLAITRIFTIHGLSAIF